MNSVFNEQILADKLSKLNSTQQCIESILFFFFGFPQALVGRYIFVCNF